MMSSEKILIVGLGEIGRTLFELMKEAGLEVYGLDVDASKMESAGQEISSLPERVDVIQACIPCKDQNSFVSTVASYLKKFKPGLLIINSTVPPGTTQRIYEECGCLVAHSPARGVHTSLEHMKWELKRWTKYVGGATPKASELAGKHFEKIGLKTKILKSCSETELAKLFETTYRAWMIACFQEMHRISRHFRADFEDIVDFLEDTHRVRLDRPVMFPSVIGGHCQIPNTRLLLNVYDSEFLRLILKSNEKRAGEMQDKEVEGEVQEIRKKAEALQSELMTKNESCQLDAASMFSKSKKR